MNLDVEDLRTVIPHGHDAAGRILPVEVARVYEILGVGHNRWRRWERDGLTVDEADDMAGRLKRHPSEIWGAAYYAAVNEATTVIETSAGQPKTCAASDCHNLFLALNPRQGYCSPRCRQRRWRQKAEVKVVLNEARRRFYSECAEYERARQRAYYAEHVTQERDRARRRREREREVAA